MAKKACTRKGGCKPARLTGRARKGKMCGLAADGKIDKMAKRVRHAKYLCRLCGHAAAKAKHLCSPREL